MTEAKTPESAREEGFDLARAFAIVFMVLINFQFYLLAPPRAGESAPWGRWLAHLMAGRSSSLFVTLAGVGVSLMARRAMRSGDAGEWRVLRKTLLLRALFLLVLGEHLRMEWSIDILHFYAFYLAFAALFVRASARVLFASAAILVLAGAIGSAMAGAESWGEHEYWTPTGMFLDVFVDGVHPIVPWFSFVLYGIWLGRQDLADVDRRRTIVLYAALVWATTEALAILVNAIGVAPWAPEFLALRADLFSTDWTPSAFYVVAASSTATVAIGIAMEIAAYGRPKRLLRALISTGQLSLTIYLVHALLGVLLVRWIFGVDRSMGLGAVLLYWALFTIAVVLLAWIWRMRFRRGPVEAIMRALIATPRGEEGVDAAPVSAREKTRRPLAAWVFAIVVLALVLATRLFGTSPPRADCGPVRALRPGDRVTEELTVLCPRRRFAIEVDERTAVSIGVRAAGDTYLELREGEFLASEDDDSGPGTDPEMQIVLKPGRYELLVRPFSASNGPFVLSIDRRRAN
jgi:uncharacterized protein